MSDSTDDKFARAAAALAVDLELGDEHPFVETDLTAYVDGKLDRSDAARVESHLRECAICREDVDDLRATAASLAPRRPARWPWYAAAAALIAIGLTLLLTQRMPAPPNNPPRIVTTTTTQAPLPEPPPPIETAEPMRAEWKAALDRAIRSGAIAIPAALADIQLAPDPERAPSDPKPYELAPTGAIVDTTRPTFTWTAVPGGTYVVSVFEQMNPVVESTRLTRPRWQSDRDLPRGKVYQWQVAVETPEGRTILPSPPAPPAMFRILDKSSHDDLQAARETHADDPLLLGVLYAERGLKDEAERELRKVNTDVGRKLLRSVQRWP